MTNKNKKEEDSVRQFEEVLKRSQFPEFFRFVRNPWKNFFYGFVRGTGFGLGVLLGATLVLTLLSYVVSLFIDIPFIGHWLNDLINQAANNK